MTISAVSRCIKVTAQNGLFCPSKVLSIHFKFQGFGLKSDDLKKEAIITKNGTSAPLTHGSVVIAAITSCTNTSNPSVMLAAGLVAKKVCLRSPAPFCLVNFLQESF